MIEPHQQDEALLHDIQTADPGEGYHLWWLGQSGFLIKSSAGLVLLDPYLSDSLTRKYAATEKPHERMTSQAVSPGQLTGICAVTSSHNHTDHLDAETLLPLMQANPAMRLVAPEANRAFITQRLNCPLDWPLGVNDDSSVSVGGFTFQGIAAAHDTLDRDERGNCRCLGYVVSFNGFSIYHSGDTLWHDALLEQLAPYSIDLALLPINGRLPMRRVAGNLWGQEAAALAKEIGAKMVVPCHYDMFTFNTESPRAFVEKCTLLQQPHHVLQCGERLDRKPCN